MFLINSREPGINDYKSFEKRRIVKKIVVGETSNEEPVTIAVEVIMLQNGNRILNIKTNIHTGYHIYDRVAKSEVFIPVSIDVVLPEGYTAIDEFKRPNGRFYSKNGTTVYKDSVVFSQIFNGLGSGEIKCKITYQCCDSQICFPPETKEIIISI